MADSGRSGRTAKDVFAQAANRDQMVKHEQEKAHATASAKIARLKALRLAREAEEKASAAPAVPKPVKRKMVRAKV